MVTKKLAYAPLTSTGVDVRLIILLGARSREMSLNGSTVVDTILTTI